MEPMDELERRNIEEQLAHARDELAGIREAMARAIREMMVEQAGPHGPSAN